ncbi:MAG: EscU/YscU/HrcU family type III secretion system export apparatus switch protein, partial [Candidatus Hydrogenedentes bacterium]|nr:EscU/YscU/HrcU family type III secretion system export apparatus switch protein [Candidatus Hydrogenedentota bacterium]
MAEKPASERTEKATPEHLKKARANGQIPESREVSSAVMTGALLMAMVLMGNWLFCWLTQQTSEGLSLHIAGPMDGGAFTHLLQMRAG